MSGVYGIIHLDGSPIVHEHLTLMSNALAHRAVDGHEVYVAGHIGLGHTLMCVSPESKYEKQPLH